jgi:hypothetical protein
MRLIKITLLTLIILNRSEAQENRKDLIVQDHHFYSYYNVSRAVTGYQTTPRYAELLRIEIRAFPKAVLGPVINIANPDWYDWGVYRQWNIWDIYANSNRPYNIRAFYGEIIRRDKINLKIRGGFISYSHLLRVGKEIKPYQSFEVGFEHKNIEYFSKLAQNVNTKSVSLLFIGDNLSDQILKFVYIRKGVSLEIIPALRFPNTILNISADWSFNTPYARKVEFTLGRAYLVMQKKRHVFITPSIGTRLFLPITIDFENDFLIDTYPLSIVPTFNLEIFIPEKILFSD